MAKSIEEETEIWKDVPGYDGKYMVSNFGRVKSTWRLRNLYTDGHVRGNVRLYGDKIMMPTNNGYGYLIVSFVDGGKRKNFYVHRLVAQLFVDNPCGLAVVNHLDYNKMNNHSSNLKWCTQLENTHYSKCNMSKQHKGMTNTGERYITKRKGKELYRVVIKAAGIDKSFGTIEKAIVYRNEVLNEIGYTI